MSFKLIIPPWLALGFYRGSRSYDYDYKKQFIQYEKNKKYNEKYNEKPQYLYSSCIGIGLFGSLLYANPFLFPIILGKEIHRLEINIRGLDEEKEKKDYNDIL
jgi:hypothetical protein